MENLNIENFNPTVADINTLVSRYEGLEIKGVDDKAGYVAVDAARKELKKVRVKITNTGKAMREEAVAFQKAVIAKEKELVALVEPTERALEAKQDAIDLEKEKLKRVALLPERHSRFEAIGYEATDEELLLLDDTQFETLFNQKNAEYLAEKERLIKLEQERIDAENRKLQEQQEAVERERLHQIQIEEAKKEAAKRATEEAERKAREEAERIEREAALKAKQEQEAQAKLEADKKYQNFLLKNGYTPETADDFYIDKLLSTVTIYKRLDSISI